MKLFKVINVVNSKEIYYAQHDLTIEVEFDMLYEVAMKFDCDEDDLIIEYVQELNTI